MSLNNLSTNFRREEKIISPEEFFQLCERVKNTLKDEIENNKGYLIKILPQEKQLIVIGDLHGDLESLEFILNDIKEIKSKILLFLGDYGDRGLFSPEVYHLILKLKEETQETILLRGNHEFPPSLPVSPHDLLYHFEKKFPEDGEDIYEKIKELWEFLPHAAIFGKKYLFLHGGIPSEMKTLKDFSSGKFLEEILWSDPGEISGTMENLRGAGKIFGKDVTERVLTSLGIKTLIRSHEACSEGFKINHDNKVLTIFSRKGFPYGNEKASYLKINLKEKAKDAYVLAKENVNVF